MGGSRSRDRPPPPVAEGARRRGRRRRRGSRTGGPRASTPRSGFSPRGRGRRTTSARARRLVVKRVEDAARAVWPRATCSVYGSSDTESTWFLSDLDLRVAPNEAMTFLSPSYAVEELAEALRERSALFGRVESRPRARVPIVVLQDRATRVSCDVSFADDGGPRSPPRRRTDHGDLMVFLKALLRDRDLAAPCVEIEFRAPRAIFMILSP